MEADGSCVSKFLGGMEVFSYSYSYLKIELFPPGFATGLTESEKIETI